MKDKIIEKVLERIAPQIYEIEDGTVILEEAIRGLKEDGFVEAINLTIKETRKEFLGTLEKFNCERSEFVTLNWDNNDKIKGYLTCLNDLESLKKKMGDK